MPAQSCIGPPLLLPHWGTQLLLLTCSCELQYDANRILMERSILLQVNVGLNTSAMATNLNLQVGERYVNRVTAYNNAGLSAFADSPALVRCPTHSPSLPLEDFVCEFLASPNACNNSLDAGGRGRRSEPCVASHPDNAAMTCPWLHATAEALWRTCLTDSHLLPALRVQDMPRP